MAQAELNITIDKLSGKIYGNSDVYIANRNGKTVISHYPKHRDPNSLTQHQRELNTSFAQLSIQAKLELTDPEKRAAWQQRYDHGHNGSDAILCHSVQCCKVWQCRSL